MEVFDNSYRQKRAIKNTKLTFIIAILLVSTVTLIGTSSPVANAQDEESQTGTLNYTQTDSEGNPDWINTGNWTLTGLNSTSPTFDAFIDMVKPDGSSAHDHTVSDFKASGEPVTEEGNTTLTGTTTITMREGPVTEEPTVISLSDTGIDVYFDPVKIDDHFGNQSIAGTHS